MKNVWLAILIHIKGTARQKFELAAYVLHWDLSVSRTRSKRESAKDHVCMCDKNEGGQYKTEKYMS